MKEAVILTVLLNALSTVLFAQELPRLAVVEFSTNDNSAQIKKDAITVRELVESEMVKSSKFQIITREDIDKLLANQKIQVSSISSSENLKKLQLQNISYIVTGSLSAMGSDYALTVRVLDVSTGQFSNSDNTFMGSGSRDMYNGINSFMTKFISSMATDKSGAIIQASTLYANSAQAYLEKGKLFFDQDDDDNAIQELIEAIKLDPNLAEAYMYRARAYNNKENYDQGLSDANTAIKLNPQLALAYYARGKAYFFKKDYDRAIVDFSQMIKMDPQYTQAYINRGGAYFIKNDYDHAIADYEVALKLDPNDKDVKEILELIRKYAKDVKSAQAYLEKGKKSFDKKDYNKAIQELSEAIKLNSNLEEAYMYRARAYNNKKNYDNAISDYSKVIKLNPQNAQAYINRGSLYYDKKYKNMAIADYEAALRLDPNNQKLKRLLELSR